MSLKRDSVAKRLKLLVNEEKNRRKADRIFDNFPVGMLNTDGILIRARALSDAVFLKPGEVALTKAFEYFELDHQKPEHWHLLINYLSRSHFETKSPGRRPEWTSERYLQLMQDFYLAAKKLPNERSRSRFKQIRELMIDDPAFCGRYKHMKQDALAKQIDNMMAWANCHISKSAG